MRARIGIPAPAVVAQREPSSVVAEAFRVLRTNLQFLGLDEPLRSILLTSAAPGEGKSTTAANLGVAFAQAGTRVCLVDADLRRPMLAKLLGLENWAGLTTALIGQAPLEECVKKTPVEGLWLLPSGPVPPNPAELLGSERMAALLERLKAEYDLVLIDSPPVLAVTDAAVLAPRTDGVVLVIRAGRTDRRAVQRARTALETVHARVLGTVLGGVAQSEKEGYYYAYDRSSRPQHLK
ncbi:MAG TPA: CpsD/CapB family tyrosine-protein kinase [Symbiobacteriaceae bacterium]|jgi:capsular exopolysaccharide synthesis family protein|nr:CpsD/CapB family tyrosine-protein kinase [Symbiobacteriaceae bacterium]